MCLLTYPRYIHGQVACGSTHVIMFHVHNPNELINGEYGVDYVHET